jgi:APA family basic amino acid/polyamine antiporter
MFRRCGRDRGLLGSYDLLAITISAGTIVAYEIVCASVLRLRQQRPDLERPFRVPLGPVVPIAGIAALTGVFFLLPPKTLAIAASWIAVGFVVWIL